MPMCACSPGLCPWLQGTNRKEQGFSSSTLSQGNWEARIAESCEGGLWPCGPSCKGLQPSPSVKASAADPCPVFSPTALYQRAAALTWPQGLVTQGRVLPEAWCFLPRLGLAEVIKDQKTEAPGFPTGHCLPSPQSYLSGPKACSPRPFLSNHILFHN